MDAEAFTLHTHFLGSVVASAPFIVPLLVSWLLKRGSSEDVSKALTYVIAGFGIGFFIPVLVGIVESYVIQLPLLPLRLHEAGLGAREIAQTLWTYNLLGSGVRISVTFASLLLVAYGIYRLVKVRKK